MKDLTWDNILSVGVDEIDDDHKKLLGLFNILNHSVTEGAAPEYLAAVLEELINCTRWHFSHEERLMLKYGYEGLSDHKTEHRDLINGVKELQEEILRTGIRIANEDLEYLERWLTQHILIDDMRMGSFLSEVM
ncbi:MAG: bacteriohemerythrin [Pseudomonadota bacterium]